MYSVNWNEFLNERGGSCLSYRRFKKVTLAKQQALLISQRNMVPGLVTVLDSNGKQVAAYQKGKHATNLFKKETL